MGKLKQRLENYAVNYSLADNREEKKKQNYKALTLLRRLFPDKPKRVVKGVKYYRTARRQSNIVKKNLANFIDTYRELEKDNANNKAKEDCERNALNFIKNIFYNNKGAIAKLNNYYLELKHPETAY